MNLRRPVIHRSRPVFKYAVSLVMVAAVLVGGSILIQPFFTANRNSKIKLGTAALTNPSKPQTGFAIYAKAATIDKKSSGTPLTPNKTFSLQKKPKDNRFFNSTLGGEGEDTDGFEYEQFTLKCVSGGITKVTYETNKGIFEQPVPITYKQYQNPNLTDESNMITTVALSHSAKMILTAIRGMTNRTDKCIMDFFDKQISQTKIKITATFKDGSTCSKKVALKRIKKKIILEAII